MKIVAPVSLLKSSHIASFDRKLTSWTGLAFCGLLRALSCSNTAAAPIPDPANDITILTFVCSLVTKWKCRISFRVSNKIVELNKRAQGYHILANPDKKGNMFTNAHGHHTEAAILSALLHFVQKRCNTTSTWPRQSQEWVHRAENESRFQRE